MLFSSTTFLFLFLPVVFLLYYIIPRFLKNTFLMVASLFFYAWGEPVFLLIMLLSIALNYIFALLIDSNRDKKSTVKWILVVTVISNLLILVIFKYLNFITDNINSLFNLNIDIPQITLPLGISFYTFQGLSYVIDVYRKDGKVQKNPLNIALYISLFPQLIAGPIVRYQTVADQITKRKESIFKISEGIKRFISGLAKKMLLANNCGWVADQIFAIPSTDLSVGQAWIGIIAYSLQIYFDFSGYSDMAIGLGKMFGFEFLENFNFPYISRSVTEFWRRWHISLSSWFRDYLYFPLGGSRTTKFKTYRNLFIVWLATGIWHGAAWNFIAWGVYYALFLMVEKAFLLNFLRKIPKVFQHVYTLLIVIVGWVFFRSETFNYGFNYIESMFGFNGNKLWNADASFYLSQYGVILLFAILFSTPVVSFVKGKIKNYNKSNIIKFIGRDIFTPLFYIMLFYITIVSLVSSTFNPFIYFRF